MKWLIGIVMTVSSLQSEESTCTVTAPKVIVMRHGQAMHNIKDTYNSDPDAFGYVPAPLTEEGRNQALATAKRLLEEGFNNDNIGAVFVSPMPRTLETANILQETGLFSKEKLHVDPRLTEVKMGELEGRPVIHTWIHDFADKYHTEKDEAINQRVHEFYEDLKNSDYCGHVIVVTHGVLAHKLIVLLAPEHTKLSTGEAKVFPLKK